MSLKFNVSSECKDALKDRGWFEGRAVDLTEVVATLTALGYKVDNDAKDILGSLLGISVDPIVVDGHFKNDEPLVIDPIGVGRRGFGEASELENLLGTSFLPLGWWLCRSHVFFSSSGIVVAYSPGVVWHLGTNLDEAIDLMLLANRPLVRLISADGLDM